MNSRKWAATVIIMAALCTSLFAGANSLRIRSKDNQPSKITHAAAIRIAMKYVSNHEPWAKEAIYDLKRWNNEWHIIVRPKSFHGLDGPERQIVLNRSGQVIHYYRAD